MALVFCVSQSTCLVEGCRSGSTGQNGSSIDPLQILPGHARRSAGLGQLQSPPTILVEERMRDKYAVLAVSRRSVAIIPATRHLQAGYSTQFRIDKKNVARPWLSRVQVQSHGIKSVLCNSNSIRKDKRSQARWSPCAGRLDERSATATAPSPVRRSTFYQPFTRAMMYPSDITHSPNSLDLPTSLVRSLDVGITTERTLRRPRLRLLTNPLRPEQNCTHAPAAKWIAASTRHVIIRTSEQSRRNRPTPGPPKIC